MNTSILPSYFRAFAVACAGMALTGCSIFVTTTDGDIAARTADAKWILQTPTSPGVLACIAGTVSTCGADANADTIVTPDIRVETVHKLRARSALSAASIHRGSVILALLQRAPVPNTAEAPTRRAEAEVLSRLLPPSVVAALAAGAPQAAERASRGAEQISATLVLGAKQAETALSGNDACVELDRMRVNASGAGGAKSFSVGKQSLRQCLAATRDATSLDAWSALSADYVSLLVEETQRIHRDGDRLTPEDRRTLVVLTNEALTTQLVGTYMKAYFNGGNVFSVDLNVATLEQDAINAIKAKLGVDAATAKQLADNLLQQLAGSTPDNGVYHLLVKKSDGGFISRAGTTYTFPGLNISVDPKSSSPIKLTKIDLAEVGSDMTRVLIEALGDGWDQIPGDPKSTGVTAGLLPRYIPTATLSVKEDQFTAINDWANRVEGVVGSVTGEAIRGISWISLNNEALAKIIETAAGVAVRKGTEKLVWCVYACGPRVGGSTQWFEQFSPNNVSLKVDNR